MISIKTGIVSYGYSTKTFHMPFLDLHPGFQVTKILERHGQQSKIDYPYIEVVRSYEEILADPDIELVVIATPNHLHYSMAKEALLSQKHVLVEKPFCVTSQEAEELIQLAKNHNRVLTVFQNRRLDSDFLTVQKIVKEGLLGEIVEVESHFDRFRPEQNKKRWKEEGVIGCDILYDLGVHLIDQGMVLFGRPKSIYADLRKLRENSKIYDYFDIHLYYDTLKVILKASVLVKEKGPRWQLHGHKGSYIKYGLDVQESQLSQGIAITSEEFGKEADTQWGILHTIEKGAVPYKSELKNYQAFYENLYQVLLGRENLLVTGEEARDTLKVIEYAYESKRLNRKLTIDWE